MSEIDHVRILGEGASMTALHSGSTIPDSWEFRQIWPDNLDFADSQSQQIMKASIHAAMRVMNRLHN